MVSSCLTSLGARTVPFFSTSDWSRPAAPAAWPVASEPVTAGITMCACPPYWVVPELRNQVPTGTFVPKPSVWSVCSSD